MFIELFAAAAMAATPANDTAAEPAPQAAPQAQSRRVCRIRPAPTGSNRRAGRTCKTEAEWRILDQAEADTASAGSQQRSSSNRDDD